MESCARCRQATFEEDLKARRLCPACERETLHNGTYALYPKRRPKKNPVTPCATVGCGMRTRAEFCTRCSRARALGADPMDDRRRRSGRCENRRCPSMRRLELDHDHACCPIGARRCGNCNRGYLCSSCNTRLGWLEAHRERWRDDALADIRVLGLLEYLWRYKHGVEH